MSDAVERHGGEGKQTSSSGREEEENRKKGSPSMIFMHPIAAIHDNGK